MTVTKHKILRMYHIQLNCDECGSQMEPSGYNYPKMKFENKCPNCGSIMYTDVGFPHSVADFELAGEDITDRYKIEK